jgi:hypothetical protein
VPSPMSGKTSGTPSRRAASAVLLAVLLMVLPACGTGKQNTAATTAAQSATASASPHQKLAKTRFVANASLAAGATYQWIVKPYKAGKFKKGAHGRRSALIKAGLAGVFTYNRLKAALKNAQSDKTLSKLVAPLTTGINGLKALPGKLRKGDTNGTVSAFQKSINDMKSAGKKDGQNITNQVPSLGQIAGG